MNFNGYYAMQWWDKQQKRKAERRKEYEEMLKKQRELKDQERLGKKKHFGR